MAEVAALGASDVLEVGCGRGVALEQLALALPDARLTGIDRSVSAVEATRRRNRGPLDSGRLAVLHTELVGAPLRFPTPPAFGAAFAVDVNAFWTEPGPALAALRRLLSTDGHLLLLYEPPSEAQATRIEAALAQGLAANGFEVLRALNAPVEKVRGVGVLAAPR